MAEKNIKTFVQFLTESNTINDDLFESIKLGASYKDKYLSSNEKNFTEIETQKGYVKSYLITNKENQPIFKGVLNILPNGSAVMNVKYVTYSGVKNQYTTFFDKSGNEIIDTNNSAKNEFKYFSQL